MPIEGLLASGADAIYLANPNAPSGTFVPPEKVAELARAFAGLLLIDEAYAEFARGNCMELVKEFPNVVVSRSLSKAYGLAGLRFGYAAGSAEVIAEMMKVKDSYNCDAIAIVAATAALEDQDYSRRVWAEVVSERGRLTGELEGLGWSVLPSEANFVLAAVPGGRAKEAYLGLKEQGILVRYFDLPGLADRVRITVGTSQETNALLGGIKALNLAHKAA